jgi:hypothetical protein
LESYKENVTLEDSDEKNMLFGDINELLIHWHNYAKTTDNTSLHQFKEVFDGVFGDFSHSIPPIDSS